jgi:transposase
MPPPYPIELRERVIALLESGREPLETADLMNLGVATVGRWWRSWKERGSVEPLPQAGGGGGAKLGVAGKEFLLNFVEQRADATLADMVVALRDHLGIDVSDSTISEFLVEHGYTWKKKTFRLKEQDAEALLAMQAKFVADVASVDPEKVVYVDECGANEAMTPTRARALGGERAYAPRPTRRGEKDHHHRRAHR